MPEQNIQNTNITGAELVREKHRVYLPITLRMALAFAALVLIGWAWDRTYDPTGAQQTLHLRAAGAVAIVLMAALLPRIRSPLLSALWLYAFALGILILFTVILHRLESGFSVGLGLYVYFSFGLVLLGLPYSFRVNAAGSLLVNFCPHAWALLVGAQFPHLQYAAMIWPACAVALLFHWQANRLILERLADRAQIALMAHHDSLTGLLNRRALEDEFRRARDMEHRRQSGISLLMLDIDHFKALNDSFGHLTGDQVLVELATVMRGTCRTTDVLARIGGEEFICLLPDTVLQEAVTSAERLRDTVAATRVVPVNGDGQSSVGFTISLGAAQWRDDESLEDLIRRADAALYEAKAKGRNRVETAA